MMKSAFSCCWTVILLSALWSHLLVVAEMTSSKDSFTEDIDSIASRWRAAVQEEFKKLNIRYDSKSHSTENIWNSRRLYRRDLKENRTTEEAIESVRKKSAVDRIISFTVAPLKVVASGINKLLLRFRQAFREGKRNRTSTLETSISRLSNDSQISPEERQNILKYSKYAAASYCREKSILSWSCGQRCIEPAFEEYTKYLNSSSVANRTQMPESLRNFTRNFSPRVKLTAQNFSKTFTRVVKYFTYGPSLTTGYVAMSHHKQELIVAFRGTMSAPNFVYDMMVSKANVSFPGVKNAKVHRGFWLAFEHVRDPIRQTVLETLHRYPDYKIVLTGHSFGGAVALLCALDLPLFLANYTSVLSPNRRRTITVYTFGQPRVGNAGFANFVRDQIELGLLDFHRIVSYNDLIPQLPPRWLGFIHAGPEIWISDNFTRQNDNKTLQQSIETRYPFE